ncbi:MAG: 23S rRNA (adenine(2503)-C(2))-methyltransferase RlmN [Gammaproteobacteria bacterium]
MEGLRNLLGLKRPALEDFFVSLGEKPFRGSQTLKWIHQHGTSCFGDMSNLSRSLRDKLDATAQITAPEIILESLSQDGTRKWLLELQGGNRVETVFIPEDDRGTLCLSSQAGCPLDCRFCSTAKQGYARNLSTDEIIGQLWLAKRRLGELGHGLKSITNVVFMGMGEPLLNLDNVACAIDIMRDDLAYGIGRRRITVSTAGIVPGIDRLKASCPVSLAVSLHAPNDALREQLVPINKRYPIADLLAACRRYIDGVDKRSQVTFEYVMLAGVNDSQTCARELGALLRGLPAKVNLIPFNMFPEAPYRRSAPEVIDRFREVLLRSGLITTTRKTRGDDIDAACGQLVGKVLARSARHRHARAAA